jgi:hypothetical protein
MSRTQNSSSNQFQELAFASTGAVVIPNGTQTTNPFLVHVKTDTDNQWCVLEIEPTIISQAISSAASITLSPVLPSQYCPPRTITQVVSFLTAVSTATLGVVTITSGGTITYTPSSAFTAATYIPITSTVSVGYSRL